MPPSAFSSRRRPAAPALLLAAALVAGCASDEGTGDAGLHAPAAMVAVGEEVWFADPSRGVVQVLAVRQHLADSEMLPAPARYFPLHLPAGPRPQALAASPDGALVFALDGLDGALRAFDVATHRPRPLADGSEAAPVVAAGRLVTFLAAAAGGCPTQGCVARLYAGVADLQTIAVIDVLQGDGPAGALAPQLARWLPAGLAPDHLAQLPVPGPAAAGGRLFVASAAGEMARLDLDADGAATVGLRWDLPTAVGPLAVLDDRLLVVARPAWYDLAIYALDGAAGPAGLLALAGRPTADQVAACEVDVAPKLTPLPSRLAPCSAPPLPHAHPADRELCSLVSDPNAPADPPAPYRAAYLGAAPRQMVWLPPRAGASPLAVACADGRLRLVTFTGDPAGPAGMHIEVVARAGQDAKPPPDPTVVPYLPRGQSQQPALGDLLAPVRAGGRPRLFVPEGGEVAVLRGGLAQLDGRSALRLTLEWEGVVATGEGQLAAEDAATFRAAGEPLDAPVVRAGDVLVVLNRLTGECAARQDAGGDCLGELPIAAVAADGQLRLARGLQRGCFLGEGPLKFQVRAGRSFLWRRQLASGRLPAGSALLPVMGRLALGGQLLPSVAGPLTYDPSLRSDRPLPGGPDLVPDAGAWEPSRQHDAGLPLMLQLRGDLQVSDQPGCRVYAGHGELLPGVQQSPLLARGATYGVEVTDAATIWAPGQAAVAGAGANHPLGLLPAGMAVVGAADGGADEAVVVVSYIGSDGLYTVAAGDLAADAPGGGQVGRVVH